MLCFYFSIFLSEIGVEKVEPGPIGQIWFWKITVVISDQLIGQEYQEYEKLETKITPWAWFDNEMLLGYADRKLIKYSRIHAFTEYSSSLRTRLSCGTGILGFIQPPSQTYLWFSAIRKTEHSHISYRTNPIDEYHYYYNNLNNFFFSVRTKISMLRSNSSNTFRCRRYIIIHNQFWRLIKSCTGGTTGH